MGKALWRFFLFQFFLSMLLTSSCRTHFSDNLKHTFYRMDTIVEVTVVVAADQRQRSIGGRFKELFMSGRSILERSEKVQSTWDSIDCFLGDYERRFSQTDSASLVLALNRGVDTQRVVGKELAEMLFYGLTYADSTGGMFDPTILPIKELWGLDEQASGSQRVPPSDSVALALTHVHYTAVTIDTATGIVRYTDPAVRIDVGGLAKGFALRQMSHLLGRLGYHNYLISAGGDILCKGRRADGKPWMIGLQHPRQSEKLLAVLPLDSGCVVTSGDYERFWILDGKRYCHIFNPKTGYSCTNNQSLTLKTVDPVTGVIFIKGFYCRSAAEILSLVEKRKDMECIIVDSTGTVFVSRGWKESIELLP
ncbi:MAG: FAD:protein FMN transferase [Chitinivibrionales bacterium]|nr:FAD:protein FMN transferase [Chitinivibrionales bacterium]